MGDDFRGFDVPASKKQPALASLQMAYCTQPGLPASSLSAFAIPGISLPTSDAFSIPATNDVAGAGQVSRQNEHE
ncbi:MAG TPA: hypothetical protein VJ577_10610 [Burkholderiaceae bacterium]|nr:hypothetical protein [Burkholderiaceae bacterium]